MMNETKQMPKQQQAGLNCPKCGQFIKTTIFELLTSNGLHCPSCHLRLMIDKPKSKQALDALRKVQVAQQNVENKSHFNR